MPRTDIDAVIFDRKTGRLGMFELKSSDPFPRSAAALARQRDNVLYANRQVSGALDWLNRNGADELLNRVDSRTARRFRVRRVLPFVLARTLACFDDGPEADRRAAWGTWPEVLRLTGLRPAWATDAHPLQFLCTRLGKDEPLVRVPANVQPQLIELGTARLVVHSSWAAYQAVVAGGCVRVGEE